jgi:hypothetical protein
MIVYRQNSPELKAAFKREVDRKVDQRRETVREAMGNGFFGMIGETFYEFQQFGKDLKGFMGESQISTRLAKLPNTWGMFQNTIIPGTSGKPTEIDILLIGPGGIFIIEVKNWKGSYSAYRDNWKRRDGEKWIAMSNSPTSQNLYHKDSFQKWLYKQLESGPYPRISAPVIFPSARWIGTTDCSVPVLTHPEELLDLIVNSKPCLTQEQCRDIINKVANCTVDRISIPKPVLRKKTGSGDLLEVEVIEPLDSKESVQTQNLRSAEIIRDLHRSTRENNQQEKKARRSTSKTPWEEHASRASAKIHEELIENFSKLDKIMTERREAAIAHFAKREQEFKESVAKLDRDQHEKRQQI